MRSIGLMIAGLFVVAEVGAQTLHVGTAEAARNFMPLITEVLVGAGFQVEPELIPQARINTAVAGNRLDAGFFFTDAGFAATPGLVKVPVELERLDVVAVTTNPAIHITSPADLRGKRVGIIKGNRLQEMLTQGMEPELALTEEAQLRMLGGGRFEVAIVPRILVVPLARQAGLTSYIVQEPSLLLVPLYFGLAPEHAALVPRIAAAFQAWIDDGRWAAGMAKAKATY